jgi:hypothetical protein
VEFLSSVWDAVVTWLFFRHEPEIREPADRDVPEREWAFGIWRWLLYLAAVAAAIAVFVLLVAGVRD